MVSDSGTGDLAGDPGSGKLWAGITALYAEPGVAEACLAAQDEAGADVLLLLAAALRARDGISLQGAGPALAAAAEPWRSEVVRPLRGLRRRWRGLGRLVGAPLAENIFKIGLLEVATPTLLKAEGDLPFRLEDLVDEHGPGVAVAAHLRLVRAGGAELGEGERHLPFCCFACWIALIAVIGGFA